MSVNALINEHTKSIGYCITTYMYHSDIYPTGKDHSLVPVVGEDYGAGHGISYKAVAVAKKSKNMRFKALKGKKSCHTGAGKTAGWNVPVGTLLREGLMMPDKSCNAYVAASKFFSESCVPSESEVTFLFLVFFKRLEKALWLYVLL